MQLFYYIDFPSVQDEDPVQEIHLQGYFLSILTFFVII